MLVSSVKPARGGGIAIRVYESTGKPAQGFLLQLHTGVTTAVEANLLEDPIRSVPVENDGVRFDAHPYEIKTFVFHVGPPAR